MTENAWGCPVCGNWNSTLHNECCYCKYVRCGHEATRSTEKEDTDGAREKA